MPVVSVQVVLRRARMLSAKAAREPAYYKNAQPNA